MDIIGEVWRWLPEFIKGNLPSWLAVGIAVVATLFALRKPPIHSELHFNQLNVDDDGGSINLEVELTTYSHASRVIANATLKLDGVKYAMILEPMQTPKNYRFATVNTFHLRFIGEYPKSIGPPKIAVIKVKARLSDGSGAKMREKLPFNSSGDPN